MTDQLSPIADLAKALSEPITKLIETVSSGVGKFWEPTHIRRKAKAEADAARIRLDGEIERWEVAQRAGERIAFQELRRQRNIESIVQQAAAQLPATVSKEQVDDDWVAQFFNHAQDVSDEEMQKIWAQLLAGEVAEPGSYSLRTLHTIRMLRPSDASLFRKFCNYGWEDSSLSFQDDQTEALLAQKGLAYTDMLHLVSLGLLSSETGGALALRKGDTFAFSYFGKQHQLAVPEGDAERVLKVLLLTDVGQELASLCDTEPDEDYRMAVVRGWTAQGIVVEVSGSYPDDPEKHESNAE